MSQEKENLYSILRNAYPVDGGIWVIEEFDDNKGYRTTYVSSNDINPLFELELDKIFNSRQSH